MSTYATAASVKDILRTNYDGCAPLAPYIKAAHSLVARMVTCATAKSYTHTTDELESITNALAAHFYCAMDALYMSRSTAGASGSFQRTTGKKLEGTEYGQMALMLDTSGCLQSLNAAQIVQIGWLGQSDDATSTYEDRNGTAWIG